MADINRFRQSMIKRACKEAGVAPENLTAEDIAYLAEETKTDAQFRSEERRVGKECRL